MRWAEEAHLSYSAAVLFIALVGMYFFSFSISVSLSHAYRRNVRLMQEVGLLEERLRVVEGQLKDRA
jgi:hypothetical protein